MRPDPTALAVVHPFRPSAIHRHASSVSRNVASPSVMNCCAKSVGSDSLSTMTAVRIAAGQPAYIAAIAAAVATAPAVIAQLTTRQAAKLLLDAAATAAMTSGTAGCL